MLKLFYRIHPVLNNDEMFPVPPFQEQDTYGSANEPDFDYPGNRTSGRTFLQYYHCLYEACCLFLQ